MRSRLIFLLSALGLLIGITAAVVFGIQRKAQPPVFAPVSNPFATAIYANGIVESDQGGGTNINLYPEVPGRVVQVLVHEGQHVQAGERLLQIDDTVQQASTEQLRLQAAAAQSLLDELVAQPRRETLAIAQAQAEQAAATLKAASDQYDKRRAAFDLDPHAVSKDVLDTAENAALQATSALVVANRQLALTRAGAWRYDISNQRRQVGALQQAYLAARSLQQKYALKAQTDGVVLAVNATAGSYAAILGVYNAYTQGQDPLVVMSAIQSTLAVRCFIDEILVSRLPAPGQIQAQMSLRGTNVKIPLEFVRVQPYLTPKIELSNQRQERVDLRVMPVIFRFTMTSPVMAYPGQLVDVFIGPKAGTTPTPVPPDPATPPLASPMAAPTPP